MGNGLFRVHTPPVSSGGSPAGSEKNDAAGREKERVEGILRLA